MLADRVVGHAAVELLDEFGGGEVADFVTGGDGARTRMLSGELLAGFASALHRRKAGGMATLCAHLDAITTRDASGTGCVECLAIGQRWVHLRRCVTCAHVGCCDSSPGKHASAHARSANHPVIQSFEPAEDWYYCYVDDVAFLVEEDKPSPSYTDSLR